MTQTAPGQSFGIDIGGTGIKGGIVDLATGRLTGERRRLDTPQPSTPHAVGKAAVDVAHAFEYTGPVGVTFPGVVLGGVVKTTANMDPTWNGTSVVDTVAPGLPGPVTALNDADAAGLAEARYGAGRGKRGVVVMVTLGTGIGTAIINDGRLVPNAELGHMELDGHDAESRAAVSVKERKGLSWEEWARRVQHYLRALEQLLWPDLIILGGGVSKRPEKWLPLIYTRTPLVVAQMRNDAGIVGAALAASEAAAGG